MVKSIRMGKRLLINGHEMHFLLKPSYGNIIKILVSDAWLECSSLIYLRVLT
jgi:hypothetical protein